jgi:hypothetical protein
MRIHGIIEVQRYMSQWDMVVLIDYISPLSIDLCRHISYNDMNFDYGETVFANRGIPDDVCTKGAHMYFGNKENFHYESHFTYEELCNQEVDLKVDFEANRVTAKCPLLHIRSAYEKCDIEESQQEDLDALFKISSTLAKTYGADKVRWVVWYSD